MFSKFFIERPIFAVVVATLLTLAGAVSLTGGSAALATNGITLTLAPCDRR